MGAAVGPVLTVVDESIGMGSVGGTAGFFSAPFFPFIFAFHFAANPFTLFAAAAVFCCTAAQG
jgi:hypothetical protein